MLLQSLQALSECTGSSEEESVTLLMIKLLVEVKEEVKVDRDTLVILVLP